MTAHVTSGDGTRIAFDRFGQGSRVVVASGVFCDRQPTQPLAEQLARRFSVINYDRRGGASPDFFRDTAARIAELLPNGQRTVLEGQDHGGPAGVVALVVADFLTTSLLEAR